MFDIFTRYVHWRDAGARGRDRLRPLRIPSGQGSKPCRANKPVSGERDGLGFKKLSGSKMVIAVQVVKVSMANLKLRGFSIF